MKRKPTHGGFTLVEVLIVVVIMAILAATIIPQFSDSTKDAKASSGKFNLHTLRAQIELYKAQHAGQPPAITGDSLPQLTSKTDVSGTVGTGATHIYGPYIQQFPVNPFNDLATVKAAAQVPPTAVVADAGWQYDQTSGQIWLNDADHLTE